MKNLSKILRGLVYGWPVILFFSYYPVISLGSDETMNFELSLPLIWLVGFDGVVLVALLKRRMLLAGLRGKWAWVLFPVFVTISVIWSLNTMRGVLTAGILWLIYFAIYGLYELRDVWRGVEFRKRFLKVFFGATLVACTWCVVQCILDLAGVPRENSLMCAGCTYWMFGFPHPSGMAIEPQFMGNLLLAPAIVAAALMMREDRASIGGKIKKLTKKADGVWGKLKSRVKEVKSETWLGVVFFLVVATLFLTFSRGAIYAFVVALIFMSVALAVKKGKKGWRKIGKIWALVVVGFVVTLNVQGLMAEVGPTSDTYQVGVAKVINHLSLGVIDVRGQDGANEKGEVDANDDLDEVEKGDGRGEAGDNGGWSETKDDIKEGGKTEEAIFTGYVEESTDTRLKLTNEAVQVWSKDFRTMMFGVGLGGAGKALYLDGLSASPKEIIQNQYASLLLECGLMGAVLMAWTIWLVLKGLKNNPMSLMVVSLILAYGVAACFFSGLPNALQMYLMPSLMVFLFGKS